MFSPDFLNSLYVIGTVRTSRHGNELGKVDIDNFVINSVRVGGEFDPVLFTSLSRHERFCDFVGGEYGSGCTEFRTHVGDSRSFGDSEGFHAVTAVFDNFADTALDGHNAENFKDNIFSGNPRL